MQWVAFHRSGQLTRGPVESAWRAAEGPPRQPGLAFMASFPSTFLCRWFNLVHGVWSICFDIYLLSSDWLPQLWAVAAGMVGRHGFAAAPEIQTSVVFVVIFSAIPLVLETPWSLYSTFRLEEKHGFNKQTVDLHVKASVSLLACCVLVYNARWANHQTCVFSLQMRLFFIDLLKSVRAWQVVHDDVIQSCPSARSTTQLR